MKRQYLRLCITLSLRECDRLLGENRGLARIDLNETVRLLGESDRVEDGTPTGH